MSAARGAAGALLLGLAGSLGLAGCGQSAAAGSSRAGGTLVVTGSSTCAPLVAEIARRFEAEHPGTRIDVHTGGSSRGIADVRRGTADVGMVSRALTREEAVELEGHVFARDGVCVVVHASNPVEALDDDDLRGIYRGRIRSWSEVGVSGGGRMTVVTKAAGRATLAVFAAHLGLDQAELRGDVVIGDNEHGIKTVAADPGAVAFVSIGAAEQNQRAGVPIRLLPQGGVPATSEALAEGRFPLSRPLILVLRPGASALAREFVAACRSEEVLDLVTGLHLAPAAGAE